MTENNLTSLPLLDQQVRSGLRGDFRRGWEIAEILQKISPNCHRAAFNRAWYQMQRGDLLEGLKLLDRGRWENAFGDPPLPTKKPIFHPNQKREIAGKHLLFRSEGGLGDEIINVRFAQDFAQLGAKVSVACDPSLASIFARVPGVSSVINHRGTAEIFHDFWVPGMSAARVLEYSYQKLSGLPYLLVDESYDRKWKTFFNQNYSSKDKPRIGLRFYGNPNFEHEQYRRFPQQGLKDTLGKRSWVNLQKEETDLPINSWEDTLAIINQLDLVITSCTSVAHASSALGKPTWVILPILPYYIWAMPGYSSPWYKSVRLFRQKTFGDWSSVFLEIQGQLKKAGF